MKKAHMDTAKSVGMVVAGCAIVLTLLLTHITGASFLKEILCVASFAISTWVIQWQVLSYLTVRDMAREYGRRAEKRTAKAAGTVVGGCPSGGFIYGHTFFTLPMAEFCVGGEVFHASGPHVLAIQGGNGSEYVWTTDGRILTPKGWEPPRKPLDEKLAKYYGDEGATREAWAKCLYADGLFSHLLPVGTEVEVAYDPDDPQGNCTILPPFGQERFSNGTLTMGGRYGLILSVLAVCLHMAFVVVAMTT